MGRVSLTPAQEASAIFRRKAIYEELHPETRQHVAGAHAANKAMGNDASEKSALAFTASTSEATGKSRRSVEIAAARGEALGPDLEAVAHTSLDKGVELDALAKWRRKTCPLYLAMNAGASMIKIELERDKAEGLLDILERRLEIIHEIEKRGSPPDVSKAVRNEKNSIIPSIMALEAALKCPPHQ